MTRAVFGVFSGLLAGSAPAGYNASVDAIARRRLALTLTLFLTRTLRRLTLTLTLFLTLTLTLTLTLSLTLTPIRRLTSKLLLGAPLALEPVSNPGGP